MKFIQIALIFLLGLAPVAAQTPLRIAAAADLTPVLPPILAEFQKETGIHAEATFQASATLVTQIQNGAPFDIFFAANVGYPQRLVDAGLATESAPVVYAKGTLVLWTRKDSGMGAPSLALLRNSALKRLAIANPDRAPYGKAAIASLQSLHLYDALKPKLVTAENIAQAAEFADSANADAGLISLTSAKTARMMEAGSYFVMPRDSYPPLEQAAIVLKNSPARDTAQKFLDFVLSAPIQAQLAQSGLAPAK
jgi:molybdate transport system substrate-binding protein